MSRARTDLHTSSPFARKRVEILVSVGLLQAVMVVDTFTWLLLVPMMLRDPDPAVAAHARRVFYSFVSYNTVRSHLLQTLNNMHAHIHNSQQASYLQNMAM